MNQKRIVAVPQRISFRTNVAQYLIEGVYCGALTLLWCLGKLEQQVGQVPKIQQAIKDHLQEGGKKTLYSPGTASSLGFSELLESVGNISGDNFKLGFDSNEPRIVLFLNSKTKGVMAHCVGYKKLPDNRWLVFDTAEILLRCQKGLELKQKDPDSDRKFLNRLCTVPLAVKCATMSDVMTVLREPGKNYHQYKVLKLSKKIGIVAKSHFEIVLNGSESAFD